MNDSRRLKALTLVMLIFFLIPAHAVAAPRVPAPFVAAAIPVKVTSAPKRVSPLETITWKVRSPNGKKISAVWHIVDADDRRVSEDVTTRFSQILSMKYTPAVEGVYRISLLLTDQNGQKIQLTACEVEAALDPYEMLYTNTAEYAAPIRQKAWPYSKQIGTLYPGARVVIEGDIAGGYCKVRVLENGKPVSGYCSAYMLHRPERALRYSLEAEQIGEGLKYVAHRGMEDMAPENSLPAYELAGQAGCWAIDADISETKDGRFICMHDMRVNCTTNGRGYVSKMTLAQIEELRLDKGTNISAYENLKVPTLEDYLAVCEKYGMTPRCDIKDVRNLPAFIDALRQAGMLERSCIRCNYDKAVRVRALDSSCLLSVVVVGHGNPSMGKIAMLGNAYANLPYNLVNAKTINAAHEMGLAAECNVVYHAKALPKAINLHADIIVSGDLRFLLDGVPRGALPRVHNMAS